MSQTVRRPLTIRFWLVLAAALALLVAAAVQAPRAAAATITAQVYLKDSNGDGLAGGKVYYWTSGSWNLFGTTDSSGLATKDVPEGSYKLLMQYQHGQVSTDPVDLSQPYTFNTVKVTLLNTGTLIYQGYDLGFHTFTNPMEMLPYTYLFKNNGNAFNLTVGTANFTGGVVRLIDHNGNGLAGGTASYYLGGWHSLPGQTDSNGNLVFSIPNDSAALSMAMSYNGTSTQQNRTQLGASNFTFQTTQVNVQLKDADGNPLDTGSASYYAGGWHDLGDTSGGQISVELLPGSYSFAMVYNSSRQQLNAVPISGTTTDVVFQTGRLTLNFSGPVVWYYLGYHTFVKPTMEFLPGNETLYLGGTSSSCSVTIPIASGDHLVKSAIVATLKNHAGQPLAGGVATAYVHGAWTAVGTTDSRGQTCQVYDGTLGNTAVRMTYNGTSQMLTQSQPTNSIYSFQTALVTVELRNSTGNLIDTGNASYYAGGWHTIGDTSGGQATAEMLPGSYSFAMVYNGTRQQLNGVAISGTSTTVTFTTTTVTVELRDSAGNLIDTGSASYYAGGWHTIGDTSGGQVSLEMLPGSYSFAMVYQGTREQKNGVAISGSTTTVTFTTGKVTSDSNTATSYYAGGWRSFTNGMELLSGSYTFHFNDGTPNTAYTLSGGTENHIH